MPKHQLRDLTTLRYHTMALRVALVVGSILFMINHGQALMAGRMTRTRWFSGLLTYCALPG